MPILPPTMFTAKFTFIVNYFLLGCADTRILVVDLNRPAQNRLFLLLLTPSFEDIVQDIFDPSGGRNSSPKRRGRKRKGVWIPDQRGGRRGGGSLDPSTLIAKPIRGVLNPTNVLKGTIARYMFPLYNVVEGVTYTYALIDALNDTLFENIIGVMQIDNDECQDLGRLMRKRTTPGIIPNTAPVLDDFSLPIEVFRKNIQSISTAADASFTTNATFYANVINPTDTEAEISAALGPSRDEIYYESFSTRIPPGGSTQFSCSGDFDADDTIVWGFHYTDGAYLVCNYAEVLVFGILPGGLPGGI